MKVEQILTGPGVLRQRRRTGSKKRCLETGPKKPLKAVNAAQRERRGGPRA